MTVTIFDTHRYVRRLEAAGVPLEQAEAQADFLTEAFRVNLEQLVTKDYLESRLDVGFAEQKAYMDKRFAEQDAHFRVLYWMLGIIVVTSVIPFLQNLMSL